jgi:hypothetical protein
VATSLSPDAFAWFGRVLNGRQLEEADHDDA